MTRKIARNLYVQTKHFDLNDIQNEPTDEQLETLMNLVVTEAKRRAELAKGALMQRLRDDIAAANRFQRQHLIWRYV